MDTRAVRETFASASKPVPTLLAEALDEIDRLRRLLLERDGEVEEGNELRERLRGDRRDPEVA